MSRRASRVHAHGSSADSEYDLHHVANTVAVLIKSVTLDKQGDLALRQRIAATRALERLVHYVNANKRGLVATSMALERSGAAPAALVQVYSCIALRLRLRVTVTVTRYGYGCIACGVGSRGRCGCRRKPRSPNR